MTTTTRTRHSSTHIEQREYDSLSLIPAGTMRGEEEDGQL